MKKIIVLLFVSVCLLSCNDLLKKNDSLKSIKYKTNKKQATEEITKIIDVSGENLGISNGYSFKNGNNGISFVTVSIENPNEDLKIDHIAYSASQELYKVLETEITNLKDFQEIHFSYYSIIDFEDAEIRKENQITIQVQ